MVALNKDPAGLQLTRVDYYSVNLSRLPAVNMSRLPQSAAKSDFSA